MTKKIAKQLILACLFFSSHAFASLTPELQQARDHGLVLYNQHMGISAVEPLRIAATAGDAEAQYYLGETLRLNAMYMTPEAAKWYEAAANQGNLFSMLRLSDTKDLCTFLTNCSLDATEWKERVLKQGQQRAKHGDSTAMIALFMAGQGDEWLEDAAKLGDHYAQYRLGTFYADGNGWFLMSSQREKAIEALFKSSAEGGYPPGMMWYAGLLYDQKKYEDAFLWRKKAAEAGFINGTYAYAKDLLNLEKKFQHDPDLVKSYALFYLVSKLQGGGGSPEYARYELEDLAKRLSAEQINNATKFAQEWEANHPPLSYFLPMYGF